MVTAVTDEVAAKYRARGWVVVGMWAAVPHASAVLASSLPSVCANRHLLREYVCTPPDQIDEVLQPIAERVEQHAKVCPGCDRALRTAIRRIQGEGESQ